MHNDETTRDETTTAANIIFIAAPHIYAVCLSVCMPVNMLLIALGSLFRKKPLVRYEHPCTELWGID